MFRDRLLETIEFDELRDFKEFYSALNASRMDVGFIASASSWKCKRIPSERINHVYCSARLRLPNAPLSGESTTSHCAMFIATTTVSVMELSLT